ncbi:hypothetical protein HK102_013557 [Quaeritorhiza haematococci]|nr:hypothetical protein HK102_013557 [Quaeritorhiza haematococci]
MTSYLLFCQDVRKQIKEQNPALSQVEVAMEMGRRWNEMDEDEKRVSLSSYLLQNRFAILSFDIITGIQPYDIRAAILREDYNVAMAEYKQRSMTNESSKGTAAATVKTDTRTALKADVCRLSMSISAPDKVVPGLATSTSQVQSTAEAGSPIIGTSNSTASSPSSSSRSQTTPSLVASPDNISVSGSDTEHVVENSVSTSVSLKRKEQCEVDQFSLPKREKKSRNVD